ncbi:chromatin assembly factor 1 subunit A-domain-containing protein [Aspergillus ambiguus]|uniref:putative chromatin assembly factor 1 subunit A n=1 Tax=Aspergillus ambiguus TaxID=176160 RepID=UPI003CCE20A0
MEVTMDSSPSLPLPSTQSYPPSSPQDSRKRSLPDVSHAADERTYTHTPAEDQENTAPSGDEAMDTDADARDPKPNDPNIAMSESTVNTVSGSAAATPASKKRKLSPVSREAKQAEKEAREKARQEERAKKEEEKRVKEEEKKKREAEREEERKKREAEREEKRKVREEEKAAKEEEKRKREIAKEEEKRKKEEERLKKERAQPKLNAFFAKPKVPSQPGSGVGGSPKKLAGEGSSAQSLAQETKVVSDYEREFPEFFLQSHTSVAPPHRFERDAEALRHMREKIDASLQSTDGSGEAPVFRPSELFKLMPYRRRRGQLPASVKEILLRMQDLSEQAGTSHAVENQQKLLKRVTMKSFRFGEDVRPPYQGTYTRRLPEASAYKMMRNPFYRGLPETNYDYDSEAEWEEPEEGEDLDSEEEEEGSEDGEDDMDGFLDDEDDQLAGKRRPIVGDLEPVCSGIRWQGHGLDPELSAYKIETISDSVTFPIDPFSTVYWQKPKAAEQTQASSTGRGTLDTFMGANVQPGAAVAVVIPSKAKRAFPSEQLAEFKQVVDGSDLTKTGLIEVLKKRFPKVSKDVLKDTLNAVATRVGQKEADKKWVCK